MKANDEQLKAINCTAKNILVTARAGSGKTFVLTQRAKRLLNEGLTEENIIILSFTGKAVSEVNKRLGKEISTTFHGLARKITNSYSKCQGRACDRLIKQATITVEYEHIENVKHIFVDEFQDFTNLFYKLLKKIISLKPDINFLAVGDDWQSIYGFQEDTNLDYFKKFENYFDNPTKLYLLNNYRSGRNIVEYGNEIMIGYGKGGVPTKPNGKIEEIYIDNLNKLIAEIDNYKSIAILVKTKKEKDDTRSFISFKNKYKCEVMTVHKSKGLEFDIVIIWNEYLLDTYVSYVAHSRAKEILYIVNRNNFLSYGNNESNYLFHNENLE